MGFIIVILFIGAIFLFFSYANISKEQVRTDLSGSNRMFYPVYAKLLEGFVIYGIRNSSFKLILDKKNSLVYEMDFYNRENVYNGKLELALISDDEPYLCGKYLHFYGLKYEVRDLKVIYLDKNKMNDNDYLADMLAEVLVNVDSIQFTLNTMGYV